MCCQHVTSRVCFVCFSDDVIHVLFSLSFRFWVFLYGVSRPRNMAASSSSYWTVVIAVFLCNIKIRDERSENEPLKRWIASVEELSQSLLSQDEISSPLKSLVLHTRKSGDLFFNLDEWFWTTADQMSALPRALLLDFWSRVERFVAHLDAHPFWPLLLEQIARQTQLPLPVVRAAARSLDAAFESVSGANASTALRWAFELTVDSWVLRYHLFRFLWAAQNRMLRFLFDQLSLLLERLMDSEDFRSDLTSFEVLEGVSEWFRFFRDTLLYRKPKAPPLKENFLQLDPARGVWFNLEKAVTGYVWLITTTIADVIRWTTSTSGASVISAEREL